MIAIRNHRRFRPVELGFDRGLFDDGSQIRQSGIRTSDPGDQRESSPIFADETPDSLGRLLSPESGGGDVPENEDIVPGQILRNRNQALTESGIVGMQGSLLRETVFCGGEKAVDEKGAVPDEVVLEKTILVSGGAFHIQHPDGSGSEGFVERPSFFAMEVARESGKRLGPEPLHLGRRDLAGQPSGHERLHRIVPAARNVRRVGVRAGRRKQDQSEKPGEEESGGREGKESAKTAARPCREDPTAYGLRRRFGGHYHEESLHASLFIRGHGRCSRRRGARRSRARA